ARHCAACAPEVAKVLRLVAALEERRRVQPPLGFDEQLRARFAAIERGDLPAPAPLDLPPLALAPERPGRPWPRRLAIAAAVGGAAGLCLFMLPQRGSAQSLRQVLAAMGRVRAARATGYFLSYQE